jgi:hypothetical protein
MHKKEAELKETTCKLVREARWLGLIHTVIWNDEKDIAL